MKKTTVIALLLVNGAYSLLSGNNIEIPKINDYALNEIVGNEVKNSKNKLNSAKDKEVSNFYRVEKSPLGNDSFKVNQEVVNKIKNNSYKENFNEEKSTFSLKNVLHDLENTQATRSHNLSQRFTSSYIAKDTNMNMSLSTSEYNQVVNAYTLSDALSLINTFTGLKLSYKKHSVNNATNILSIGVWTEYDNYNQAKYITLEPKTQSSYLFGNDVSDKAFFYFKNYDTQYNKDVHFKLKPIEIIDLYEKLIVWKVDKEYFSKTLAYQLLSSLSSKENFNSKKAYQDLISNADIKTIQEIKESYNNLSSGSVPKKEVIIRNEEVLSNIIKEVGEQNSLNYVSTEGVELSNLSISIPDDENLYSFSDLEEYSFFDKTTFITYRIKALNNKYLLNSPKDFILYAEKDSQKQEAFRYLQNALESAKKIQNRNFTYDVFKKDIDAIKKGLL